MIDKQEAVQRVLSMTITDPYTGVEHRIVDADFETFAHRGFSDLNVRAFQLDDGRVFFYCSNLSWTTIFAAIKAVAGWAKTALTGGAVDKALNAASALAQSGETLQRANSDPSGYYQLDADSREPVGNPITTGGIISVTYR